MEIKDINLVEHIEDELNLVRTCYKLVEETVDSFESDHASNSTVENYKDYCKERILFSMQTELDRLYTVQKYYGCRERLRKQEKSNEFLE